VAWALYSDVMGTTRLLGANPITAAEDFTGQWTLRFLALTLAITPVRRLLGWNWLIKYRRMLGLFTFFYVCIHLSMYIGLDYFFDLDGIVHDIIKHPYVTVGMAGFVLLVPLAATSTKQWIRRLGGKRWNVLHRLVYVVAICGVVHYLWAVKRDVTDPLAFAVLFGALLAYRLYVRYASRAMATPRTFASQAPEPAAHD
jgi:sulfoxide reductase heme-binding subunit YedZ